MQNDIDVNKPVIREGRKFRLRAVVIGVVAGLLAGGIVLSLVNRAGPPPVRSGPILSECDGTISELAIHYVPEAADVVVPVYRQFLASLPADVTVHVVCPAMRDFESLRSQLGELKCRLNPVVVHHPITFWSRDRWVATEGSLHDGSVLLLSPAGEDSGDIWPARAGDQRVGQDIASALAPGVSAKRSGLYFDGGDFMGESRAVFVSPQVVERNVQVSVRDRRELVEVVNSQLGRPAIILDGAPPHHVGMYMMVAGDGVVVVGDPAAGRRILEGIPGMPADNKSLSAAVCPPDGPDFSEAAQKQFDAVAERCRSAGYRVVRIPTVPGRNGRTYVTYVNVIIDRRDGKRIVYMPTFRGLDALNQAGKEVWQCLGFSVQPIDCTDVYTHFGTLHCLVNVVRKQK